MITFELCIILTFLTAFFSAIFVLPKLTKIARRIGLLDQPNGRKVHTSPRPLVGGIGMVIAATFTSLLFVPINGLRGYFLGLAVLLVVGFFDDFKEMGHKGKFLAQILATSLLIYFSSLSLVSFGDLLGVGELIVPGGILVTSLVTIFCVVGVTNAVNLIDGLDGLAGGLSFIAFIFFAVHASFSDAHTLMLLNLALAGAVLGFLRYNWHPSVLFMGDAGSLCLGFSLSFMALALTQAPGSSMSPVAALLILAVPITDTIIVMVKRIIRGGSPFQADKYHLHHIFLRYGMSKSAAVKAILSLAAGMGCLSIVGRVEGLSDAQQFSMYLIYFVCYLVSSFYIIATFRCILKFRKRREKILAADTLLSTVFGVLDLFKVFRKSPRYQVRLPVQYAGEASEDVLRGRVVDISRTGLMARVDGVKETDLEPSLTLTLPFGDEMTGVTLPVELMWETNDEGGSYCGFRFKEMTSEQERVIGEFINSLNSGERRSVEAVLVRERS